MAGTAGGWALFGLALGHADAVRLFAAYAFVQAIRSFSTLEVTQSLAGYVASDRGLYRRSRRLALRIEVVGMLVSLAVIAALAFFLEARGMSVASAMAGIIALSVPARHPGGIFVIHRKRDFSWRLGQTFVVFFGALAVFVLGLDWTAAAVVLALREWGGLAATALFAPPRPAPEILPGDAMRFRDAAARTEATARKKLGYRMMKSVFGLLLGPFGTFAARTGRGTVRMDIKIANLLPRSRVGMALLAGGAVATAVVLLLGSSEPAALLGAGMATRIGASAASALLWWRFGVDQIAEDEDLDD